MTTFTRWTAASAVLLSVVSGTAVADTYRLATNVSDNSTAGQLLAEFADAVNERTEGRVEFRLFNDGVLGRPVAVFPANPARCH